jgi:hypothetical protein
MSPPRAVSPPSLPLRRQAVDRTKSLLEIDQTGVAKDPLSRDTIPTDPGHFNNSGCFIGRAWRRDVSTLAGIHLSPFGIVAPARGRITPIKTRVSGQGGPRSVSKAVPHADYVPIPQSTSRAAPKSSNRTFLLKVGGTVRASFRVAFGQILGP